MRLNEIELKSSTETIDPDDGKKVIDIQPLLDLRDGYKLKTTARTVPGLIRAITTHEKNFNKEVIESEKSAFVGEKTARAEASLKADLADFRLELGNVEADILAIETNITALNADHDTFLRNVEENEIERNKI